MSLKKPDSSPIQIDLSDLRRGRKGITPAFGEALEEAASVCLEERGHSSPTQIRIIGFFDETGALEWTPQSDQSRRCWNDDGETTEHGAYGIAALLVEQCGLQVVQRSKKKTGFDFWLGDAGDHSSLFQNLARLEASGIREGDAANLES